MFSRQQKNSLPKSISIPSKHGATSSLSSQVSPRTAGPQVENMNTSEPTAAGDSQYSTLSLPPFRGQGGIPQSPTSASLPPLPTSPDVPPDSSRNFFLNPKASKSSSRVQTGETIRKVSNGDLAKEASGESRIYRMRHNSGSSPDLPATAGPNDLGSTNNGTSEYRQQAQSYPRRPLEGASRPQTSVSDGKAHGTFKKSKPRPFAHLLNRTRSIRVDPPLPTPKSSFSSKPPTSRFAEPELPGGQQKFEEGPPLKTAPLAHEGDRTFRDMMASSHRNRSADRQPTASSENGSVASLPRDPAKHSSSFSSFRDNSGMFLSNLRSSSTKAADGLGKAGKGIFGKLTRSGSSGEREPISDENYVCRVINLPLVAQTRRTRIGKRLEHSKDKTEFWMPALPWRCIDYLNYKGCEEEGLYRIPGSGPKIKEWQRRFDTENDINLFDEPELYDINIIGSMFKAWLRELPDEIFPKATQEKVAKECMGATEVPQMLKDELSKLPPFNYYLLFAITCHLSLLHSYVEKNKMDYRNLCICFQPCLKIDSFCFQFLVCSWKQCWQGCWTEKDALVEEYRYLDGLAPYSAGGDTETSHDNPDERAISSSDGSEARSREASASEGAPADKTGAKHRPPPLKDIASAQSGSQTDLTTAGSSSMSPASNPPTSKSTKASPMDEAQQLPPILPVMPLSPLNL